MICPLSRVFNHTILNVGQMTPTELDLISGRWRGLRDMANTANRNVTKWWMTDENYSSLTGAFPHVDFVMSTGLIDWSISSSLKVAKKQKIHGK